MTAKALARYAETKGWRLDRTGKGSHRIYSHSLWRYKIVIPDHGAHDIARGTLAVILKQIDGRWSPKS